MIAWTAFLSVQLGIAGWTAHTYQEAYDEADHDDKPLLVLVGAQWCPGCQKMKTEMIPKLQREGGLAEVVFTTVDTDHKPALSRRLLRGNAIPQLVLYTRGKRGWRRSQLTGVHAPAAIREFLRTEMASAQSAEENGQAVAAAAESSIAVPLDEPSAAE